MPQVNRAIALLFFTLGHACRELVFQLVHTSFWTQFACSSLTMTWAVSSLLCFVRKGSAFPAVNLLWQSHTGLWIIGGGGMFVHVPDFWKIRHQGQSCSWCHGTPWLPCLSSHVMLPLANKELHFQGSSASIHYWVKWQKSAQRMSTCAVRRGIYAKQAQVWQMAPKNQRHCIRRRF